MWQHTQTLLADFHRCSYLFMYMSQNCGKRVKMEIGKASCESQWGLCPHVDTLLQMGDIIYRAVCLPQTNNNPLGFSPVCDADKSSPEKEKKKVFLYLSVSPSHTLYLLWHSVNMYIDISVPLSKAVFLPLFLLLGGLFIIPTVTRCYPLRRSPHQSLQCELWVH